MHERCQEKKRSMRGKMVNNKFDFASVDFAPASDGSVFGRKASECGRLQGLFSACSALLRG
jgi:hypothetical protein